MTKKLTAKEKDERQWERVRQEVLKPTYCMITLDCAPGCPRPSSLLGEVLKGTGIKGCKVVSKFFGEWVFRVPKKHTDAFIKHEATIIERIKALYHRGAIRYGGWSRP